MPFRRSRKFKLFAGAGFGSVIGPMRSSINNQPDPVDAGGPTTTTTSTTPAPTSTTTTTTTTTTPGPSTPGAPRNLESSAVTSTSVTLTWDPPVSAGSSPITDYPLEYSRSGEEDWVTYPQVDNTTGTVVVTGLSKNTVYDFRIYAANGSGRGPASDVVTESTQTTAPGAPQNLYALGINIDSIELTWDHNEDDGGDPATESLVEFKKTSDGGWTTFSHDFLDGATTILVDGLDSATSYDFRVSDINDSNGVGDVSDVFTVSTAGSTIAPPGNVNLVSFGGTSLPYLRIAWDPVGGNSYYKMYYRPEGDIDFNVLTTEGDSSLTFLTIYFPEPGRNYEVRMSTVDGVGEGPISDITLIEVGPLPSEAPTNIQMVGGPTDLENGYFQIDLTWNTVTSDPPIVAYQMEYQFADSDDPLIPFITFNLDGTGTIYLYGDPAGHGVKVQVSGGNDWGWGTPSLLTVLPIS